MSVMLIIFLSMAAYVLVLALLTWYGNSTEKQLGYPKQNETLEDVRFLLRQGENGLAASCYPASTNAQRAPPKKPWRNCLNTKRVK